MRFIVEVILWMNAYWKHRREHEKLLAKHLKEEMNQVNRVKSKIEYR